MRNILTDNIRKDAEDDRYIGADYHVPETVRRIFKEHVAPHWKVLSVALVTMTFVAATTGALPFLMKNAADQIFVGKNTSMLYMLPLIVIVVMAVRSAAEYVSRVTEAFIAGRVTTDLQKQLFETLALADLGWLHGTHSGRFVSVFMNDVGLVRSAAASTLTAMVKNLLSVFFLVASMLYMDWLLTLLLLIVMPLGGWLLRFQRKRMKQSVNRSLQGVGDLGRIVAQTLAGIRVVKAYDQETRELERAETIIERTFEYGMQTQRTRAATGPITEGLSGIGFAGAIFYGGWQGIHGGLTLGDFMGFMTAAMLVYQPFKSLASLHNTLMEGVIAANRVYEILDRKSMVQTPPDATPLAAPGGAITFENVTYAYEPGKPVLIDFSLEIPAGSRVALVGPSGAGKSTVLNLVPRFFDPESGRVLIDGEDIRDHTLSSVRRASALLTQDPVIFDDTVGGNIRYGSPDASQEDLEEAAQAAAASEFIAALPKGFDTEAGEDGNRLSGGQKQRIAFARAILKNAPIILLDEPTSALDAAAEAKVQDAMDTLLQGRTVLMIAHRLSTVKKADKICVMDAGRVVEVGSHDELLARKGLYASLHAAQFTESGVLEPAAEAPTEEAAC
ncbi:ABC transporter transmembrane domain-containing protein [Breoghania sp. L-A4]|uniref:ABC transporter ATP-binding protein n=1 Tax=Breoghania sp. L-A4 TaxID=2304600 RepID=UPI000E35DA87|nr:ABC transporter transmembrane domain-containing protein [Breoghania sp. L-A4]AXS39473.1 ATP-binding cassette domain-containing protein [Breoghania sp. L-A4]